MKDRTALGARLTLVASPTGGTTKALTLEMIETATRPGRGHGGGRFGDEVPERRRVERRLFPGVNHHFQRDPAGTREGYDRLPTQELAPEVLATLCSWLGVSLR